MSLRARRDPQDRNILLSMVDEYETEFKLLRSEVSGSLTAEEVLALFRDADPTPLATSCQIEFSSVFYPNLVRSEIDKFPTRGVTTPDVLGRAVAASSA